MRVDEVLAPGEEAEPRPYRAVLVEARCSDIDPEFQHARLVEGCGTDPRTAGVIDVDDGTLLVREANDRVRCPRPATTRR